jgi:hypothetical protein
LSYLNNGITVTVGAGGAGGPTRSAGGSGRVIITSF